MNFNDKIEPFLISDDHIIQEFITHTLHDYPNVKEEWIERLLIEAIKHPEKAPSILAFLPADFINENAVRLLVDGVIHAPISIRHLYVMLLFELDPEFIMKHKDALFPYLPVEYWDLYEKLVHGTEEDVRTEYQNILNKLENEPYIDTNLYRKAKKIAYILVNKGWVTEKEIDLIFEANLKENWFDYNGILAVYMIRLMNNDKYIDRLAPLLVRDEDILLEEVAATLISFQTDEVVEAVKPYLIKGESNIFATSIIENIKTDNAVEALRKAYHLVDDDDMEAIIIEALSHQLSISAEPEINDYVRKRPSSFLVDVEQLAYSYYKILGINHPLIDEWKNILHNRENEKDNIENVNHEPISVKKVGRNEPCPCGSGKKYKKCCG